MKYRKTATIDAEPYRHGLEDGFDTETSRPPYGRVSETVLKPYLNTKQGKQYINPGDYIITNPDGERYPCPKDTFEATYEEVK